VRYRFQSRGQIYTINIERKGSTFRVELGENTHEVGILDALPGEISLLFDGRPVTLFWAADGRGKWLSLDGCTYLLEKPSSRRAVGPGEGQAGASLRAPMPAQVQAVNVIEGEEVEKGQTLILLEAMKMEIRLAAPQKGRIVKLPAYEGQSVERDQLLVEIEDR
jgi:acetyl/propionyl-CoA carboxylase alpha subunit